MSAAAALQKWLELKNKTFTPIFSDTAILGETKMDVSRKQVSNERIMDFLFFFLFYISLRILVFLSNSKIKK